MKIRHILSLTAAGLMAALVGCSTGKIAAEQNEELVASAMELDEFFREYAKTKSPDSVSRFLPILDNWAKDAPDERLIVAGNMPMIGFFCHVFNSHPDSVKAWSRQIAEFKSAKLKELLAVSLYLADTVDSAAEFEKFKLASSEDSVLRNLATPLPKLDALLEDGISTPEQLDYCWGSYMATSDLDYAMKVFEVAVRETGEKINGVESYDMTVLAARWSMIEFMQSDLEVRIAANNRLRIAPDYMLEKFAGKLERGKINKIFEPDLVLRLKAIKAAKY